MILADKTIMVRDYGLFNSWAQKLAYDFGRVLYYCPFKSAFPRSQQFMIGTGIENVERVTNFWDHIGEVDLFFFPDIYDGDIQVFLREEGWPVWGAGKAEELELYRWQTKELLRKDIGLPVQPVKRIFGITGLRGHLMENENKWVKISMLRGDFETFHHETYPLSEPLLDEIENKLGPYKESKEFIVEDSIDDAVEIGYDGFTVDGKFPNKSLFGFEIKDLSYIGAVQPYAKLGKPLKLVNEKLAPLFANYNYRGFWSSELRVTEGGKPYLTDPCCRAGSPPSELYQEMFANWGEIIWAGAHGELVEPTPVAQYGVEVLIHSDWANQHWQAVYIEPQARPFVKLRNFCQVDDVAYVAPQSVGLPEIGAILGIGDSLINAIRHLKKNADMVSGYSITKNLDNLPEAIRAVQDGSEKCCPLSDDPLPTPKQIESILSG